MMQADEYPKCTQCGTNYITKYPRLDGWSYSTKSPNQETVGRSWKSMETARDGLCDYCRQKERSWEGVVCQCLR